VTAGLTDNTDLFLEDVGEDGTSVRIGDEFVPCSVHHEVIEVKDADPVTIDVVETPHGPIVGPAMEADEAAVSMRAVWLDDGPTRGILALHRVRNVGDLKEAYRFWPALPLNIVSADDGGAIAWQLVGEAPIRKQGWGTLPAAGWDPNAGWHDGTLSVDELPGTVDPEAGFLATANNKTTTGDDGPFIGLDFIDGYRAARITERLGLQSGWTLESAGALQMDQTSVPWREMRSIVLSLYTTDPDALRAIEILAVWDGVVDAGSSAATVYEYFVTGMARRVVSSRAPQAAAWALGKGFTVLTPETGMGARRTGHLVRLLRDQPEGWFERGWDTEISDALAIAVTTLERDHGADPEEWQWGSVRPLTLLHALGEKKPLDRIFNLGPFPWGGDANTVAQAGVSFLDPPLNPGVIASMRMAVEVGEWGNNRFVLPAGQSGNPLSPHYADQLPLYRAGEALSIAWAAPDRAAAIREYLEIRPT